MTTATKLPAMPAEELVFPGLWELTWAGSYWTISVRKRGGKIGYEVSRDRKRVAGCFVSSRALARDHIRSIVEKEHEEKN